MRESNVLNLVMVKAHAFVYSTSMFFIPIFKFASARF